MEVEYRRIMGKNYMVHQIAEKKDECYEEKMLINNEIMRLLPMECVTVDGKKQHIYSISSRQSLQNYQYAKPIDRKLLTELLEQLEILCRTLPEYLLGADGICLDLSCIFIEPGTTEFYFCYFLEKEEDFAQELQHFIEQLIQSLDYKDEETVHFIYALYQKIVSGCTDLEKLTAWCGESPTAVPIKEETPEEPVKESEEDEYFQPTRKERIRSWFLHFFRKHPDKEVSAFPNVEEEKQEEPIGKPNENADHFPTVLLSETEETPHYLKYEGRDSYLDFILPEGDFIIGKNADCVEGYIKNEKVSRMHALIRKKDNAFFLQDLNSTNGTYLNHELLNVQELRQLHDGDEILFANVPYRFCEH